MLNILCVCGNGMGTSTILKISVKGICDEYNIKANIDSCSFGEATAYLSNTDIILTSPEWSSMIPQSKAIIAETKNLIDKKGVENALISAIKEHFPQEIK